ncbi:264R [Invertebrate iridescent virus Kaz2018]|uniref:264R n=1 Tax=Invertebrate iridescent virus 6 TaxID=176652 RepID=Q91FQ9_IIV6|nr:264R [Invertebrate iridescent virus 6]AAK82125.1 264R [Invertebrate iridescent virus 6]QNH08673.1 264R [Invertebrate iridescent virus Kaz2018]
MEIFMLFLEIQLLQIMEELLYPMAQHGMKLLIILQQQMHVMFS